MSQKHFTLSQYSAMALGMVIGMPRSQGAIHYKDIEPDIVLDTSYENYLLDIDQNGTDDLKIIWYSFVHHEWSYYGMYITSTGFIKDALIQNSNPLNGVLGKAWDHYFSYASSSTTQYYPMPLEKGAPILLNGTWQYGDEQIIGWKLMDSFSHVQDHLGYWTPGAEDKYLGCIIHDAQMAPHFGWVRLTMVSDVEALIIKDFAYEDQPFQPIAAGTVADPKQEAVTANIYEENNIIYIQLSAPLLTEGIISMYDMNGRAVYTKPIIGTYAWLQPDLPHGVYSIWIKGDQIDFNKEIVIQ